MKFTDKELLLFDFDGTLIDSVPDLTNALNVTLANYALPTVTVDEVRPWVGNGALILLKRAISRSFNYEDERDDIDAMLQTFLSYYHEHLYDNTIIYDGVIEGLTTLLETQCKMAIVTNKPFDFIEPILDALNMKHFFSFWIGGDSLAKKKPDAMQLLHTLEHFQIPNSKAIMIGDTNNDILAAKAVPMQSIAVTYGYNEAEILKASQPDAICGEFQEVCELLV